MAVNIKFDLVGNPEPPTIILANRNGNKLGQLNVDDASIELVDKFNDASEFSFTMNKYINNKLNNLWDKVVDFKLVYCKEWDLWFEITVELDESNEIVKTVTCTQLGQAELSQIMLYNIHINEEGDSNWDKDNKVYKSTILYNPEDTSASLLHRLLKDKAPHYHIEYVSPTIAKLQRTFSFDGTSIHDAFMDIAEEIGCLFVFHSNTNEDGKINRAISVYDLWQNCNSCGHRGEYSDVCPKCGSEDIYEYGTDTLIFVTADELASDGIEFSTDTDSVKNCFKLEAGDDLMTATIRNCNPNGTDYIWRFSEDMKEDMSEELVRRLAEYDDMYKDYRDNYISELDIDLVDKYNNLVEKYEKKYNAGSSKCLSCNYKDDSFFGNCPECGSSNTLIKSKLKKITSPIVGYSSLMNIYYDVIDFALFLESSMMPSVDLGAKTNAEEQAALLSASSLSPVAVEYIKNLSKETARSAVLSMARIIVKPTYKIEAETSGELADNGDGTKTWNGSFEITNYSDESDTAKTGIISVVVNGELETFIKQKVDKALSKEDSDDMSISGLFKMDYDDFCEELKLYALNPLTSFYEVCQICLTILAEQGAGNESINPDLYKALYKPFHDKSAAIEAEIKIREAEVDLINGVYKTEIDSDGKEYSELVIDGLRQNIEKCRNKIQDELDFEKYLGDELWIEFSSYRREDKYSNDNYKSDGLSNVELFEKAMEFYEIANNEIYKSSEFQHSISTSLNNLLAIDKFKSLVDYFNVGNWIRVQVDDKVYKLRLIEYGIDFGSFDNISVDFSDVTKIKNGITDVKEILSQASSMATSYSSVKRQAKQGENSNAVLNNWFENGLSATNTKIVGANNQSQVWDKNGILCREYDPITEIYSNEQLRIINSTIAITDDNWETTKTAIGKYQYEDPSTGELKTAYGVNGETIVGKLLIGEQLDVSNDVGTLKFGLNGLVVESDKNIVAINPNNESIFNISNNSGNIFSLNEKGELVIIGNITASSLTLLDGTTIETDKITGLSNVAISGSYNDLEDKPSLSTVAISGSYNDLSNKPTKLSDFTNDNLFITKDVNDLTNYYKKTEVNSLLDSKANINELATVATSGSYNDLTDISELKNWVLEQIESAINQ